MKRRFRNNLADSNSLPTWALLCAVVCTDVLFRIIIYLFILSSSDCLSHGNIWNYEPALLPSAYDQFRLIWAAYAVLAITEVARTFVFRWPQKKFVVTTNLLIAVLSISMFLSFSQLAVFNSYEKGELANNELPFFINEAEDIPIRGFDLMTAEYRQFYDQQCKQNLISGNLNIGSFDSRVIHQFVSEGGTPDFDGKII